MLEKNSTILDNAGTDSENTRSQKISSEDDADTGSRSGIGLVQSSGTGKIAKFKKFHKFSMYVNLCIQEPSIANNCCSL